MYAECERVYREHMADTSNGAGRRETERVEVDAAEEVALHQADYRACKEFGNKQPEHLKAPDFIRRAGPRLSRPQRVPREGALWSRAWRFFLRLFLPGQASVAA